MQLDSKLNIGKKKKQEVVPVKEASKSIKKKKVFSKKSKKIIKF